MDRNKRIGLIDLHRHLDGALFAEDLATIIDRTGPSGGGWDEEGLRKRTTLRNPGSLTDFLSCFEPIYETLDRPAALREAGRLFCRRMAAESVAYAEPRIAPSVLTNDHQDQREVVQAILQGLRDGEAAHDVRAGLVLCLFRGGSESANRTTLDCALENGGVVGIDLAGDESQYGIDTHADQLREAVEADLGVTVHAGETGNVEEVRTALRIGADRIGHGVALRRDEDLQQECIDRNIAVEQCLTSNLHTGAVQKLANHPLPNFLERGVPVVLSTDDPAISDITLSGEYDRARQAFGLDERVFERIRREAAEQAFVTGPV